MGRYACQREPGFYYNISVSLYGNSLLLKHAHPLTDKLTPIWNYQPVPNIRKQTFLNMYIGRWFVLSKWIETNNVVFFFIISCEFFISFFFIWLSHNLITASNPTPTLMHRIGENLLEIKSSAAILKILYYFILPPLLFSVLLKKTEVCKLNAFVLHLAVSSAATFLLHFTH